MIERTAAHILAAHLDGKLPVGVQAIALRMGIEVIGEEIEESGRIELLDDRPRITVNTREA
ncbi:MAG: hypothetical protein WHS85_10300 [Hydrogenophilus sp.]|jgi:hypothetical protein